MGATVAGCGWEEKEPIDAATPRKWPDPKDKGRLSLCVDREPDKPEARASTRSKRERVESLESQQAKARLALSLALSGDDAQAISDAIVQCTMAQIPESELEVAKKALLDATVKWKELEGSLTARSDDQSSEALMKIRQRRQQLEVLSLNSARGTPVDTVKEEPDAEDAAESEAIERHCTEQERVDTVKEEPDAEDAEAEVIERHCTEQERVTYRLEHAMKRSSMQELADAVVAAGSAPPTSEEDDPAGEMGSRGSV
eukprot:TRINITY_DN5759_c0_g1_i3.p1 TRINITY_DN5759_c0_g1~~TRINITY_DN5759_c0_g1_i3.p1  ORF type:complete len:257 (+),score=69.41 TRINITY_DN5759_c0_g1_i3:216-986(+)